MPQLSTRINLTPLRISRLLPAPLIPMRHLPRYLALLMPASTLAAQTPAPAAKPAEPPQTVRNNDFYPRSAEACRLIDYFTSEADIEFRAFA